MDSVRKQSNFNKPSAQGALQESMPELVGPLTALRRAGRLELQPQGPLQMTAEFQRGDVEVERGLQPSVKEAVVVMLGSVSPTADAKQTIEPNEGSNGTSCPICLELLPID